MTKFNFVSGKQTLAHSSKGNILALYSAPGGGKTSFCATATAKKKVLMIDSENSIAKIWGDLDPEQKNEANLTGLGKKPAQEGKDGKMHQIGHDIGDLLNLFQTNLDVIKEHDVIVVDSLTDMVENYIRRIRLVEGKSLTWNDWGKMADDFGDFLETLRLIGVDAIITVHETEDKDNNTGGYIKRPKTDGNKIVQTLIRKCDHMFYLGYDDDGDRTLFTAPDENSNFIVKHRGKFQKRIPAKDINYEFIASQYQTYEVAKATKEDVALLKEQIDRGQKIRKFDLDKVFGAVKIPLKKLEELDILECQALLDNLKGRNDRLEQAAAKEKELAEKKAELDKKEEEIKEEKKNEKKESKPAPKKAPKVPKKGAKKDE